MRFQDGGEGSVSVVLRGAAPSLSLQGPAATAVARAGGTSNPLVVSRTAVLASSDDRVPDPGDDDGSDVFNAAVGECTHGDVFAILLDAGLPAVLVDDAEDED